MDECSLSSLELQDASCKVLVFFLTWRWHNILLAASVQVYNRFNQGHEKMSHVPKEVGCKGRSPDISSK